MIAARVALNSAQAVKDLAFRLRGEIPRLFLVLGAEIDGKPLLTVMISDEVVKSSGLDAGKIVREAGKEIRGAGEASPSMPPQGAKMSPDSMPPLQKQPLSCRKSRT